MAVGVPLAGQELVFTPVAGHQARLKPGGRVRVVAGHEHDRLAVGCQPQAVRPVLSAAADLFQMSHLVVLVVAVSIAQPIDPDSVVAMAANVKAVKRDEQSLRAGDGGL